MAGFIDQMLLDAGGQAKPVSLVDQMMQDAASPVQQQNIQPDQPSYGSVALNAANKGIAAIPDMLLNTPNNILNLGKAAYGSVATAFGRPDLAPELTPNPNLAHGAMSAMGFVNPQNEPQTTGQRLLDSTVQGAVGMGVSPTSSLRGLITNLAGGAASGLSAQGTQEGTGNEALAIGAGMLTPGLTSKAIDYGSNKTAQIAALRAQNSVRDQTLQNAKDAGFKISPSEANPGLINNTLEGIAGKLSTRQNASKDNQSVTNGIARSELGLPADAPLTPETMQAIRNQAYIQGYKPVENLGTVLTDGQYFADLAKLSNNTKAASNSFPNAVKDEITPLTESLKANMFNAGDALKMTQILRNNADASYRAGNTDLGFAQKGAAKALENQIERALSLQGQNGTDLLTGFRDARTLMAKSHTVEDAIKEGSGNVMASKLASRVQAGKPLTDGLRTIGETANIFPKNMQSPEAIGSTPGTSPLDVLGGAGMAIMGAMATGHPSGAAAGLLPLVRPLTRNMLLSDPYQNHMTTPSYDPSMMAKLLSNGFMSKDNLPLNAALIGALRGQQSLNDQK